MKEREKGIVERERAKGRLSNIPCFISVQREGNNRGGEKTDMLLANKSIRISPTLFLQQTHVLTFTDDISVYSPSLLCPLFFIWAKKRSA
jgi:hypothetical protein